jgi:hypothetical protein
VLIAVALGAAFGLIRGFAVLLGRTIRDPESLRSFHRRFSAIGPQIRLLTVAVEGGCFLACIAALWATVPIALLLGAACGTGVYLTSAAGRLRRTTGAEEGIAPTTAPEPRRISA